MEISVPMIRALIEEQKKVSNEKLILHLHEYHSWQAYSLLLFADKEKTRITAQHHGGRSPFRNLKKYKRLFVFLPALIMMQFFENLLFKKVDTFYPLSDEEAKYIENLARKSEKKFLTMGIGDKYFKKFNKEKIRKKLKLDLKKKYILYLGRIKSTKGIKELLDSIGKFENEDLELLLVGEGSDSEKYKNYLVENGIKNARFLGAIYGDAKLDYLAACNCLILPSYTEGAPVVLMEAIARNLPVIATNVGGIPKMIKGGREGIIIKPKSKDDIVRAIKEILKWKKKSISEFAEKYKWGKIIKETLADYKR
jgi:glycosyltransferase involved in cell wall biosynthesis